MRHELRSAHRSIVLSVGWIARQHKRMHYVIEELASLPAPRPFLLLLGAMTEESDEVVELGTRLLGSDGFLARSVPPSDVGDYYRAVNCFVLASLSEGFGRVYIEALMHGLPVIAHRHPVTDYVLGQEAVLADLSDRGRLAPLIAQVLREGHSPGLAARRWASVRDRFGWDALRPAYREMFLHCLKDDMAWRRGADG
jgi:1,2-diacylglycerol 3-alpha-glucosyltransferase